VVEKTLTNKKNKDISVIDDTGGTFEGFMKWKENKKKKTANPVNKKVNKKKE